MQEKDGSDAEDKSEAFKEEGVRLSLWRHISVPQLCSNFDLQLLLSITVPIKGPYRAFLSKSHLIFLE